MSAIVDILSRRGATVQPQVVEQSSVVNRQASLPLAETQRGVRPVHHRPRRRDAVEPALTPGLRRA